MSQGKSTGTKLVLVDNPGLGRVHVDMEAFFELSFWLAEELEDLVAKWQPIAAPKSNRSLGSAFDAARD